MILPSFCSSLLHLYYRFATSLAICAFHLPRAVLSVTMAQCPFPKNRPVRKHFVLVSRVLSEGIVRFSTQASCAIVWASIRQTLEEENISRLANSPHVRSNFLKCWVLLRSSLITRRYFPKVPFNTNVSQ